MDSTRTADRACSRARERGFTLLELVVTVGVLALAGAATAGAFAALARNAAPGSVRDAALTAGENALARARAAVAYGPTTAPDGSTAAPDRAWALVPGSTTYLAGAQLRGSAPCGASATAANGGAASPGTTGAVGTSAALTLRLPVTATFDPAAQTFTVVVTYPRDPCALAGDGTIPASEARTVTLSESLPPSMYAPGQTLTRDVAVPARM